MNKNLNAIIFYGNFHQLRNSATILKCTIAHISDSTNKRSIFVHNTMPTDARTKNRTICIKTYPYIHTLSGIHHGAIFTNALRQLCYFNQFDRLYTLAKWCL